MPPLLLSLLIPTAIAWAFAMAALFLACVRGWRRQPAQEP